MLLMGTSTISMAIVNSFLLTFTRPGNKHGGANIRVSEYCQPDPAYQGIKRRQQRGDIQIPDMDNKDSDIQQYHCWIT